MSLIMNGCALSLAPPDVLTFALEAHVELRKTMHTDVQFLAPDMQAMWAKDEFGDVAAIMLWTVQEDGWWWVELLYTSKDKRREGVMRALWKWVLRDARIEGSKGLRVGVAEDNRDMRDFMARASNRLVPDYVLYDIAL